ncbi:MAG: hypothetical protein KKA36_06355 [Gammaproteobacteria bacterium]|nr:hypothetical protein [Gammaproteobacteria bacterium]MBU2478695.1 hypothetical protein [Gammaproteobacteria bacterium]
MDQRTATRKAPTQHSFDTRPAQVEAWVANLPLANIGESSRRLFGALVETNGLDFPAEQRFRMLELFCKPISHVCAAMKTHFVGKPFPLSDKARQIIQLSQALMTQMALGYSIVLDDSTDKRGLLRDNKPSLIATYRALTYLGQTLLRAYQVYAPYPADVWRQVHQLYQHAETKGFAQTTVNDTHVGNDCEGSIENAYKRILLLALACPYRLRQGEVEQVYTWLCDWAQYATLNKLAETRNPNGQFMVNLDSDDPPTYLVLRETQDNQGVCRLLNASRLADVMREAAARQRNEKSKLQAINEHVLRRLMLAWGVMPKRRFSRAQKHSTAVVAMGLSASHYFVSGEVAFEGNENGAAPTFNRAAQFEASETADQQGQMPDLWELGGAQALRDTHPAAFAHQYIDFARDTGNASKTKPVEKSRLGPNYQTHLWKMVNVSAGGYRLLWDSSESSQAQVGELLGLRENSDPDSFHLSLGVVRWMKQSNELGLELGVEMLSPGAVAVGTKIHKLNSGSDYMRSLLLPAIKTIGQPATLLTMALPYHVGDIIMVNSHGKEARVELTKLVENTGTFAQFQFRPLDSQSSDAQSTGTQTAGENFSDLWNQL